MTEIYAVKLSEKMEHSLFNNLLSCVSEEKQARIQRFVRWKDAHRALIGDILIRTIISERMQLKNEEIIFVLNEYGKPFLKDSETFHFNISHSGAWVICAFDNSPIGADVEFIRPIDSDIAKRFFSKGEHSDLLAEKDDSERLRYFYDLWTLKESYIKAAGKGLSIPLDSFTIRIHDGDITLETENEFRACHFSRYEIDRDYKLSVCATGKAGRGNIEIKRMEELSIMNYEL